MEENLVIKALKDQTYCDDSLQVVLHSCHCINLVNFPPALLSVTPRLRNAVGPRGPMTQP